MKDNELVVRYCEKSKMVLKLDKLFPRTKGWLNEFEKKVLRYCPNRDEVVDYLVNYLQNVKIPGLPEELKALDGEIEAAHEIMLSYQPKSWKREGAEWQWRHLKGRKARWPNYCAQHDMNVEVLQSWKRV